MWLRIQNENSVQTDDKGHFVIDRLPAGEARVRWQPERHGAQKQPDRYYRPHFVDVRPGQATRLDLVFEGAPSLLGRIVLPDAQNGPRRAVRSIVSLVPKSPEVPLPPGLDKKERQQWLHVWRFTESAKTYRQWKRSIGHPLELRSDGSFRVDEIEAGVYDLLIRVSDLAEVTREVVIPLPASKEGGGSVDLGNLTLDNPTQSHDPR